MGAAPRRARVLVSDGDSRTALACVRSLVAAGHEVWTVARGRRSLAGVSRGVHSAAVRSSALENPRAYALELAALARTLGIDVLLPVSDGAVDALLLHRELLPRTVVLPLPSHEVFREGTDKIGMLDHARRAGFRVPVSILMESRADTEEAIARMTFPAILKPHRSVVTDDEGRCHKLDVEFVADADAVRASINALPQPAFPVVLQERIRGRGEGLFSRRWNGDTIASFAHRRLREKPPAGGISVLRESIACTEQLEASTASLLGALDWQGVAMVECKVDRDTGEHVFMELNGRLWGSLQLAIDAGVDFPALLVACALGESLPVTVSYRAGVRSRWFWGDVDHLYARLAKSPAALHLEAPFPSRMRVLRDFLVAPFSGARLEIERVRDPMPSVLEYTRRLLPPLHVPALFRRQRVREETLPSVNVALDSRIADRSAAAVGGDEL